MNRLVPVIVALTMLAGCATVTFRRGAGPGDMRADEDACRATSTSEAAYAACLRERGWLVAGKAARSGKPAPAAPRAAAAPPATAPAPAAPPTTTKAAPAGPPPASAPPASAGPAAKASASATAKPTAAAPVVTAPAAAAPEAEPPAEPEDPLARIAVSSWWKLGGTAAELDRAMAKCASDLGAAHEPAPGGIEVTIGMRDCLREAKWFPLGGTGWR